MGVNGTDAKQRFNSAHYTQVKISVKPETAAAFKDACAASAVSMASVLAGFMNQFSGISAEKKGYSPDLSTKRQRRAAVRNIIQQLERVKDNEEFYMDNIPDNLQGSIRFESAEICVSNILEAIELLESTYWYH